MKSSFLSIFCFFLFFFLFFFFFCFFFVLLFFVFLFGGFRGHVRWPFGPPHLALNPPYLFFCFFVGSFPFFAFHRNPVFPQKRHFLFIFQCFPFFLPSLFGLPLFHFLFLCLSLFLFFVPSFLSFFFALIFVSCFCLFFLFLSSLLLFHEKNNIKILNYKVFVTQSFLIFVGFLSSFFFQIPFPYLCFSWF